MKREDGTALVLVMVASVFLTALGLGLTLASMTEFSISTEFENHEKAMMVADAGFSLTKEALRGQNINAVLSSSQTMPKYLNYVDPAPGTFAFRNPFAPIEARSIDFNSPPASIGTHSVSGLITPPTGNLIGPGRYFAKISDNNDDADPSTDVDGTIYIRAMGIFRGSPFDVSSYGSSIKNSVAIIEGMVKRDSSFNISSPFTVYGPDAVPDSNQFFNGNSFNVDGFDHSSWTIPQIQNSNHNHNGDPDAQAAVSVVYDDAANSDATMALNSIYNDMSTNQMDNLEGAAGPFGPSPSLRDDTDLIRNSNNPDATNIFDPNFMADFINRVSGVADIHYSQDTTLSGSNIQLGTEDNPKIVVADEDLQLTGGGSGAGIMVVKGRLNYSGAFNYNGVILVVGDGDVAFGGANKSIIGGLFVAELIDNNDGTYSFGNPAFTLGGNSNFYFRSASIQMGLTLLPLKTLAWREITPEIEP